MTNEFIPYEQALALKELGFDEPCFKGYFNYTNTTDNTGDIIELLSPKVNIFGEDYFFTNGVDFIKQHSMAINHNPICNKNCSAPLFQQAFRWFREKYQLYPRIGIASNWSFEIDHIPFDYDKESVHSIIDYGIYEEAELACLKELILLISQGIEIQKTK